VFVRQLENELLEGSYAGLPSPIKIYTHPNIILVKPSFYILNMECHFDNYHFPIPAFQPPTLKIGRREYTLSPYRAMAINPEQSIKNVRGDTKQTSLTTQYMSTKEYTALFVNKRFLQGIAYNVCGKAEVQFVNDNYIVTKQLKGFLESFAYEFVNMQQGRSLLLDCTSTQIAIQLLRELKSNLSSSVLEKTYQGKSHASKATEFMREYYTSDVHLDDLCKVANLSPYHFIRVFKAEIGKTPHEYLLDLRIEKAKEMIKANQYALHEIADICGFIKQSHFCTVFKKRVGVSPSTYRKEL
jgi:AraC-like DNA-binding protein